MLVFHGYESTVIFWTAIVLIVFFSSFFSYRARAHRYRVIETLVEKGQPIPPELLSRDDHYRHGYYSSVQQGIFLMCIGVALAVFFWAFGGGFGDGEHIPGWLPVVGIFPFMVGLARLLGSIGVKQLPK
jgi:hypothetical protein